MQAIAVGSVIQLLSGVTSVFVAVNKFGKVVEALYVVLQPVEVGSVIQFLRGVTSDCKAVTSDFIDVHVALSHLAASMFGNVVDAA